MPDAYTQYAVGFDRQIAPLFGGKDQLTITIEFVGEDGATDITSNFRPFDNDIVLRLFWEANDFSRTSLEARAVVDVTNGEVIAEAIYKTQLRFIHDDLSFLLGARYIGAERGEPGFFALFPDNSSVRARLRWDF